MVPPCLVPPLLVKAGFEPFSARERLGLEKPKVGEPPLRNLPGGTTTSENIGNSLSPKRAKRKKNADLFHAPRTITKK